MVSGVAQLDKYAGLVLVPLQGRIDADIGVIAGGEIFIHGDAKDWNILCNVYSTLESLYINVATKTTKMTVK